MTESTDSNQPLNKPSQQEYLERFQTGLNLFEKAFHEYMDAGDTVQKKDQLEKVMSQALNVMNETAGIALKKDKAALEGQLNRDFNSFINNPTAENQSKISDNIKELHS